MKVLIADDSKNLRERLAALLDENPDIEIVGQTENAPASVDAIHRLHPDAVLLDIRMPSGSGLDVLKTFQRDPRAPVFIVLTNYPYAEYRRKSEELGASRFFDKSREFLEAVALLKEMSGRPGTSGAAPRSLPAADEAAGPAAIPAGAAASEEIQRLRDEIAALQASSVILPDLSEDLVRRADELETLNRELLSLCLAVSRELKAPIRSVESFSRTLRDEFGERIGARGRDFVGRIESAAAELERLVGSILELAKTNAAGLAPERLHLSSLAKTVLRDLQKAHPRRLVEIVLEPDAEAWGDKRLVKSVLEALFENAWKFTGPRVNARIEFGSLERPDGRVFFVRDNGVGFAPAEMYRLFVPFGRLHDPGRFPGRGIGLAVAQRILHRHGGRIWAQSEVDKGATFYFTLPKNA